MSSGGPDVRAVVIAACLALAASSGALAQAEAEPEAPAREAMLCLPSDEAGASGRAGALVPIMDDGTFDPAFGCTFPVVESNHPFARQEVKWFTFPDVGLPGVIMQVNVARADLSRRDLRAVGRQRNVATAGRLRPGAFRIIDIEHDRIPANVGINVFTSLDDDPFNDTPLPPGILDSPLAGVDGGYTTLPGSPPRDFVTDFRDGGNTYYQADVRRHPFAAMAGRNGTTFLIPASGVGTTFTPFVYANDAMHYIDIFPNGALPVSGTVPLFPACGPSQEVVHQPLVIGGQVVSNSTDWISAAIPLSEASAAAVTRSFGAADPYRVGVAFDSADPSAGEPRRQRTVADLRVADGNLYARFPSGLLAHGYHRVADVRFDPTGDVELDALLGWSGIMFDTHLVPISVTEAEGLIQTRDACLPPGEQSFDPMG